MRIFFVLTHFEPAKIVVGSFPYTSSICVRILLVVDKTMFNEVYIVNGI